MTFGLEKCHKARFIRGKLKYNRSIVLDADAKVKELDRNSTWKNER